MNARTRQWVGGALWGLGVLVALTWGGLRDAGYHARGVGFAPPVKVAALEPGRLLSIEVGMLDHVEPDQVIVRLDPAPLEEEREVLRARLALEAANDARRFAQGAEGTLIDHARVRAQVDADRALVASLEEQLEIERGLREQGASSNQAVRAIERDLEVARARVRAGRRALALASGATEAATERLDGFAAAFQAEGSEITARALEQVDGRIARLELSAGIAGVVTEIYRAPGDVVAVGEPILEVSVEGTDQVVAWLPASAGGHVVDGSSAKITRASGEVLWGDLISVATGPQKLPKQLWAHPARPEWGLPVRIHLTEGQVGPAEPVMVRI